MPKVVYNEHEYFIYGGGDKDATLKEKTITTNGTYLAVSDNADGYSKVDVNVNASTEEKSITSNGTYTPSTGNVGFSKVTVNVNQATEEKSVTSNGTYTPSSGKIGFSKVTVKVNQATETKSITSNGTYKPSSGKIGFSQVTVSVNQATETKSITANGTYKPSSGKLGFSQVTVNVPTASRVTAWSGSTTGNVSVNLSSYKWVYVTMKSGADYPEQPQGSCMLPVGGGSRAGGVMGRNWGWADNHCMAVELTATTSGITKGRTAGMSGTAYITSVVGIKNLS